VKRQDGSWLANSDLNLLTNTRPTVRDLTPLGIQLDRGLPRWFEIGIAALGLMVASPIMLAAFAAIRLTSPGPALFRQTRMGRFGTSFTLLKFRTMTEGETRAQLTARGDGRITPVGRLLRRTKLDELPELWHIICGEMSLVGPRPEVSRYVNLADPMWQVVLHARPGLTDPVTLRLRNEEDLLAAVPGDPEVYYRDVLQPYKLRGYCAYLRRRNTWTDIGVLLKTAAVILVPRLEPAPTAEELRRVNT
jgi:lipopolysaccharide/colanic/teichoic acid biosynthesis glycosyltransferase